MIKGFQHVSCMLRSYRLFKLNGPKLGLTENLAARKGWGKVSMEGHCLRGKRPQQRHG